MTIIKFTRYTGDAKSDIAKVFTPYARREPIEPHPNYKPPYRLTWAAVIVIGLSAVLWLAIGATAFFICFT